jgi:hypothetical protein
LPTPLHLLPPPQTQPHRSPVHPLRGPPDIDGPQPALADAALEQYRLQHRDRAFHQAMAGGQYAFWEPCPRPRWVLRCGPTTGCTRAV